MRRGLPHNPTTEMDLALWALAQQVYQSSGHYEPDNMPNWTALRLATSAALNGLLAHCSDPKATLDTLNDRLNYLLRQQGVAAG